MPTRGGRGRVVSGGGSRVYLDQAALGRLLRSPEGAVGRSLYAKAILVENEAKRRCPVDQGALRSSIHTLPPILSPLGLACFVGSSLKYAAFVHDGTGLFGPRGSPIVPVRGQFLRWENRGRSGGGSRALTGPYVFARSVVGSPPRPFLRDALAAVWR